MSDPALTGPPPTLTAPTPPDPAPFPAQMAALRRERGLSLRALARLAGLSHDALGAWERGERLPRLPELGAALTALGADPAERLRLIAAVPAARARRHARAAGAAQAGPWAHGAGPPAGGDLLRALRGRAGLTQADAARAAGVTQARLTQWERSEDWPAAERLERLCRALGATPEEEAALTGGRGGLPAWGADEWGADEWGAGEWDERECAGAWSLPARAPAGGPLDGPLLRLIRRVYARPDALRDLRALSLERALWLRALDSEAYRSHLHAAYAFRARALMEEGRHAEAGACAARLAARPGPARPWGWEWAEIAAASALRPGAAAARLAPLVAQEQPPENRAWMLSELALALAGDGRADAALRASRQAQAVAARVPDPYEVPFRRRDHAAVLAALGRYAEALDTLETATALLQFGTDPRVRHRLLAARCHRGLGDRDAAWACLAPVLPRIERESASDLPLRRLWRQAQALLAGL